MARNPAQRRYLYRFFPAMTAYVVSVAGVSWLFDTYSLDGAERYAVAALPALPIIAVLYVIGRYLLEETDEFVRLRLMISIIVALGLTLSFCATWGFLEIYADVPKIGLFNVVWGFFAAQLVGGAIVSWWYR